jgi:hypothetical protein
VVALASFQRRLDFRLRRAHIRRVLIERARDPQRGVVGQAHQPLLQVRGVHLASCLAGDHGLDRLLRHGRHPLHHPAATQQHEQ